MVLETIDIGIGMKPFCWWCHVGDRHVNPIHHRLDSDDVPCVVEMKMMVSADRHQGQREDFQNNRDCFWTVSSCGW